MAIRSLLRALTGPPCEPPLPLQFAVDRECLPEAPALRVFLLALLITGRYALHQMRGTVTHTHANANATRIGAPALPLSVALLACSSFPTPRAEYILLTRPAFDAPPV